MRKLKEVIKPLVTEKHYCHDQDMSILVVVIIFVGKKCWLITIKRKQKFVSEEENKIFIEFLCDYLYFQAFLPPMIPIPWTKSLCSQTKKLTKKTKLVGWQFEGTEWIKRYGEKRTWRSYWIEIESKIQSLALQKQKPCKIKRKGKVSQVFCLINKTTDGYLDGGIDDMRYWNTISWT